MSRFAIFYSIVAASIVLFYTVSTACGWEYFHSEKEKTTEEAKREGYRGGHFIFIPGPRGGK
ncbi:MAG: hypothetical protein HYS12_16250 [Planctomycetes bacterium]|nr:hypothetical protein [Planctomycetota bacterium]